MNEWGQNTMKLNETFICPFMAEYILHVTFVSTGRRWALTSRDT